MAENYGAEPAPQSLSDEELSGLLAEQRFGALATVKENGRPHLSTVRYAWDARHRVARISTIAGRLKVRQLQKDPRCSLYVAGDDFRAFAIAEGEAELSPVSLEPGDEVGLELLAMQAPFAGAEEELAFLRQVVEDRRLVIRLRVARLSGTSLPVA
ncbi:pyridoxamine 5'-phosphate oxidase family protein [[Actinomadura] parvosata]|uniref:pyridoxamine 5'-phosphate oxidase family protein n=1 Tax=[Actinomadura] parvosata TaxID=1955412 RepID=UPI00406C2378